MEDDVKEVGTSLRQLPHPNLLKSGWVSGSQLIPNITKIDTEKHLIPRGGEKAFKDRTGLTATGYVVDVWYHSISHNVSYAYIAAECTAQKKLNDPPYTVWLCVDKVRGREK